MAYPLLETIHQPDDLRALGRDRLPELAEELRAFLIDSVSKTGGHLASNLGVVELTLALHYVFNTPEDRIVWDVGHQTYPHKIITGRREAMATLRKPGGIAGFPRRSESEFDTFGTGHSSTSISAALGMAVAAQLEGSERRAIAVIGDGAMTAGMAFEALNNAGAMNANLLVVLNDNEMSISPNVGALNNYLAKLISGKLYTNLKRSGRGMLRVVPPMLEFAKRAEEHMKGMVVPSTLFEEFGFNYIGPIDGHDLDTLITTLRNIRELQGPQFLHIVTQKGHGYSPAEDNPNKFHGVGKFNPSNGYSVSSGQKTYTQVFSEWLVDMAEIDPKLIGITPAMSDGSGLNEFALAYPERFFDVGIAEQHAVTFAAGLAVEGWKPVVAIYSTFLQRAYDQLIHDVALQNLPVMFAIDRAGLVGADGPTHAGSFDLSYLRCIPNMVILAPSNEDECRQMLYTAFQHQGPTAVRYPRGGGIGKPIQKSMSAIPMGQAEIVREPLGQTKKRVAILAFGSMVQPALEAGNQLDALVVNMRFIKPLDKALIAQVSQRYELIVTAEENAKHGGAGSAVLEYLESIEASCKKLCLGLPDNYLEHGIHETMLAECGLNSAGIVASIEKILT